MWFRHVEYLVMEENLSTKRNTKDQERRLFIKRKREGRFMYTRQDSSGGQWVTAMTDGLIKQTWNLVQHSSRSSVLHWNDVFMLCGSNLGRRNLVTSVWGRKMRDSMYFGLMTLFADLVIQVRIDTVLAHRLSVFRARYGHLKAGKRF